MPPEGFEHTMSVSEQVKAVYALDRPTTVRGAMTLYVKVKR
jgi:hypothetical protein